MITASEYFGRIPIWNARTLKKSFTVYKDISSLPITRLEHWKHFQKLIGHYYNDEIQRDFIFRGQQRYDWRLISSLKRAKKPNFFFNLEKKQLDNFRQAIRGRIQDQSLLKKDLSEDDKNELWSIGQHHGLMTPLLDWTYSPYFALFFAFIEEDTIEESLLPNDYRAVYMLDSSYFKNSIKNSKIKIFEPTKDEYGRLVNQDGLFTISTLEIDIETEIYNSLYEYLKKESRSTSTSNMANFACKVYIKNEDREECLKHLDYMNVNHKSLFPDLQGSAYFCNYRITDLEYNLQKPVRKGGSLAALSKGENSKYKKEKLYYIIRGILNKKLRKKLSNKEKIEIKRNDSLAKKEFDKKPANKLILVPQIEILAGEIARQIGELRKLPIPSYLYKNIMRIKFNLILNKFNFKNLEPIQTKKKQVVNKIMAIIKK